MARFRSLLDKVYPANVPENAPYRENYLKTAILSFLPDRIAIPILEDLRQAAIKCIPVSAEQLQRTAYSAERFAQITIKTPLQFSRTLQTAPVASLQFNSIKNVPPFIGKKKRNKYSNKFIETPRDDRGQVEDQQEGEAENELFNLEEEFIFQGPEGQEGF